MWPLAVKLEGGARVGKEGALVYIYIYYIYVYDIYTKCP